METRREEMSEKTFPLREADKLAILSAIFREMWETADPPSFRYDTQHRPSFAERLARLDKLWQEAAGVMAAETYPDKGGPMVECGSFKGEYHERPVMFPD